MRLEPLKSGRIPADRMIGKGGFIDWFEEGRQGGLQFRLGISLPVGGEEKIRIINQADRAEQAFMVVPKNLPIGLGGKMLIPRLLGLGTSCSSRFRARATFCQSFCKMPTMPARPRRVFRSKTSVSFSSTMAKILSKRTSPRSVGSATQTSALFTRSGSEGSASKARSAWVIASNCSPRHCRLPSSEIGSPNHIGFTAAARRTASRASRWR